MAKSASKSSVQAFEQAFGEEAPDVKESPLEPAAAAQTETPEAPVAETPEAPAAEVPAEDTTDYKAETEKLRAELQAQREEHQKQREGMLRAADSSRWQRRFGGGAPQQPLTQAQTTTAASQGVALKWNEKGEAFIDPTTLAGLRTPDEEIERRIEARVSERLAPMEQERMRNAILSDDPVRLTPILGELDFTYRHLDSLVQFKQQEMGSAPFASIDEAVNFIEFSGVADKFRAQYPHIAPDRASMGEFISSAIRPTAETVRAFVKKVADRKSPAALRQSEAAPAFDAPPQQLGADKPRPHAERGGSAPAKQGSSMDRELEDLMGKASSKGEWSLSQQERERVSWLTRAIQKRAS